MSIFDRPASYCNRLTSEAQRHYDKTEKERTEKYLQDLKAAAIAVRNLRNISAFLLENKHWILDLLDDYLTEKIDI